VALGKLKPSIKSNGKLFGLRGKLHIRLIHWRCVGLRAWPWSKGSGNFYRLFLEYLAVRKVDTRGFKVE
jgi:hypothetical protein